MKFKKISFEGAFNRTFYDLNIDYWAGLRGDMIFKKDDGFYIKGTKIPIRKSLWGSFENEFIREVAASNGNRIIKFMITPEGGYMVKLCGDRFNYFMDRLVNMGSDIEWKEPCLGER